MNPQTYIETPSNLRIQTMRVQIGDICFAISCRDSKVFDSLQELLNNNFLSNRPADIAVGAGAIGDVQPDGAALLRERGRTGVCRDRRRHIRQHVLRDACGRPARTGRRALHELLYREPGLLAHARQPDDGKAPGAGAHHELDRRVAERASAAG